MAKNFYPNYQMRTAIIVEVHETYEHTDAHTCMMTDNQWNRWLFKLKFDGVEYRYIDDTTILITKRVKKG